MEHQRYSPDPSILHDGGNGSLGPRFERRLTPTVDEIRRAAAASALGNRLQPAKTPEGRGSSGRFYQDAQDDLIMPKSSHLTSLSYGSKSSKDSQASNISKLSSGMGSLGSSHGGGSILLVTRQPPPPPGYSLKGRGGGAASESSETRVSDVNSTGVIDDECRRARLEEHDALPPPTSSTSAWCDASTVASNASSSLFTLSMLHHHSHSTTTTMSSFASDGRRQYERVSQRQQRSTRYPSVDRDPLPPLASNRPPPRPSRLFVEEPSHVTPLRTRSHNLHPSFDFNRAAPIASLPTATALGPSYYPPQLSAPPDGGLGRGSSAVSHSSQAHRSWTSSISNPQLALVAPIRRPSLTRLQMPPPPVGRQEPAMYQPLGNRGPAAGAGGGKMIEIAPGILEPLRGSEETWRAIQADFYRPATCVACGCGNGCDDTTLFVIQDARYVLCPACKVVGPVDNDDGDETSGGRGGGVGLGFTHDDLVAWLSSSSSLGRQYYY